MGTTSGRRLRSDERPDGYDRLIDLVTQIRFVVTEVDRALPAWTPAEAAVKRHLEERLGLPLAREILRAATRRFGTALPRPLFGLGWLSPTTACSPVMIGSRSRSHRRPT